MTRIYEEKIIKGMTIANDPRLPSGAQAITNFDATTFANRLVPYRASESGDADASTLRKQIFTIALRTGTTYSFYALGNKSGSSTLGEFTYKNISSGNPTDMDDSAWANTANNQTTSGTIAFHFMVYYKTAGYIYAVKADGNVVQYDPSGSAALTDNVFSLGAYTNPPRALVHRKTDKLYIGFDNFVWSYDGSVVVNPVITLPNTYYVTSLSEYGGYMAIAVAPVSGIGASKVFLWDLDSSVADFSEIIDWGDGDLKILQEVDGLLVGISLLNRTGSRFVDRVIFRYLNGTNVVKFEEFLDESGTSSVLLPLAFQRINNRLYFMMSIKLNGAVREGTWSVGRNNQSQSLGIVHERTPNNNTALFSGQLYNFFYVGDFLFQSFLTSATYSLTKTVSTASYSTKAIYESQILSGGDNSLTKKLIGVTVTFEPLPTDGQVLLSYKKDEETSFTTIYTHTTLNSVSHSAINIESTGVDLPEFKEITFRIESTGSAAGVNITGGSYKAEVIDSKLY